jgi:Holliday junction resolvase RusA-like endonuclease
VNRGRGVEYRFVVPGRAVSFRSQAAMRYRRVVGRCARLVFGKPLDVTLEIRLDYFHSHERRVDMDNVSKCVLDGLNGVAYSDDRLAKVQTSRAHDLRARVDLQDGPVDLVKPLRRYQEYLFVRIRLSGRGDR